MLKLSFVLCEHMLATSVSLPLEQMRAAESLARAELQLSELRRATTLDVKLLSATGEPVPTHTGLQLPADGKFEDNAPGDIVFLPALWRNPKPVVQRNTVITQWLKQAFEQGSLIAGVGTGCCFMAEAGLLDNKPATTHWHYFDHFQRWYPQVHLKRQYFITKAGNLYCTGSVNSMADLTIHFIQRFFSRSIASHVERHFFHEIRRAYESSVSYQESVNSHPDEDIVQAQIWLQDNLSRSIVFADLASQFGMSIRNFSRRFKAATGQTPLNYLQSIRIESAKDLLQTTNLTIEEIMYKSGYQDISHFNQLFKKYHATTPGQYRTTVRAKLFSID